MGVEKKKKRIVLTWFIFHILGNYQAGFFPSFLPSFLLSHSLSFLIFRTALLAYVNSQSRGRIGTTVASYATATAMWDPSYVCDVHNSSQQHWILNPLSEARDQDPSRVR